MKSRGIYTVALTAVILLGHVHGAWGQEAVTITECYAWARENYPLIHQYGLIDRAERYDLSNAGKAWLPQLSVNAKASYQSDVTKLPFDQESLSAIIPGIRIPTIPKDQYQLTAQLDQTIWDGGRIRSTRALTRAEAEANREELETELYALNDRVNQLYFGCLLQDELIRQNALLQKEWQLQIERVRAMVDNGVANDADRESMEVELLNARQTETELRASREAYRQMLGAFIGRELGDGVELRTPDSPEEMLSMTINRPELRSFEAQDALLETRDRQITSGLMPQIGAYIQGGYGQPGLNILKDGFRTYYSLGVRLSWNLGKLYTLRNDRRKIEVSRRQVETQRETFLFNTRLELLRQHTEIRKLTDLMRSDEEIVRLRESIRKAAEVKLENGVVDVTDLIREINAEDMARQNALTRRIQRLSALYDYMYTTNGE